MCFTVFLHNLSPSPLWSTSWSGTLHFILHAFLHPVIVFATHIHTIAACLAVVPRSCHLILVSLSTLYLELLSFILTSHIHLTILVSVHWSITSFSSIQHTTSHTSAVQSPSYSQWCIPISKQWYNSLNLYHLVRILASIAASASSSTLNMSSKEQNLFTNYRFALALISTLVQPVLVTGNLHK